MTTAGGIPPLPALTWRVSQAALGALVATLAPVALVALPVVTALAVDPGSLVAQTAADSAAIRVTALDYIEGWYAADAARMERSLHPHLAKRYVERTPDGGLRLTDTSALELVQQVRAGGGSATPQGARRTDIHILDIFQDVAAVRVDAHGWIDYMHLAKLGDRWLIVNVLWEIRRPPGQGSG
jgi:Putative lumazine-binding